MAQTDTDRTRSLLNNLIRLRGYTISQVAGSAGTRKSHLSDYLASKPRGSVSITRLASALSTVGWINGRLNVSLVHNWSYYGLVNEFIETSIRPTAWDAVPVFPDEEGPTDHIGVIAVWIDGARIILRDSKNDGYDALCKLIVRAKDPDRPMRPVLSPFYDHALIVKNPKTWDRWSKGDLSVEQFDETARGDSAKADSAVVEVSADWAEFLLKASAYGYTPTNASDLIECDLNFRAASDPEFASWLFAQELRTFQQSKSVPLGKRLTNAVRKLVAKEASDRKTAGIAKIMDLAEKVSQSASNDSDQ